jgi:hypothetical protein
MTLTKGNLLKLSSPLLAIVFDPMAHLQPSGAAQLFMRPASKYSSATAHH